MSLARNYAEAITHLVHTQGEEVFPQVITYLKKRGHEKLLPAILRELQKSARVDAKRAVHIEVANITHARDAEEKAKALGMSASEVTVNGSLLSGWRAWSANMLVDHSGKRHLVEMYKAITR